MDSSSIIIIPLFVMNDLQEEIQYYYNTLPQYQYSSNRSNSTTGSTNSKNHNPTPTSTDKTAVSPQPPPLQTTQQQQPPQPPPPTSTTKCQILLRQLCTYSYYNKNTTNDFHSHTRSNNSTIIINEKLLSVVANDDIHYIYSIIVSIQLLLLIYTETDQKYIEKILFKLRRRNNNDKNSIDFTATSSDTDDTTNWLTTYCSKEFHTLTNQCWIQCLHSIEETATTATATSSSSFAIARITTQSEWIQLVQYIYQNMYIVDTVQVLLSSSSKEQQSLPDIKTTTTTTTTKTKTIPKTTTINNKPILITAIHHPLQYYTTTIIPQLSQEELYTVTTVLSLSSPSSSNNNNNNNNNNNSIISSSLGIMKQLHDRIEQNSTLKYSILRLDDNYDGMSSILQGSPSFKFIHSCIPNSTLSFIESLEQQQIRQQPYGDNIVTTAYNSNSDDNTTTSNTTSNTTTPTTIKTTTKHTKDDTFNNDKDYYSLFHYSDIDLLSLVDTTTATPTTSQSVKEQVLTSKILSSICCIEDDDSVQVREERYIRRCIGQQQHQQQIEYSCTCLRCKFEMSFDIHDDDFVFVNENNKYDKNYNNNNTDKRKKQKKRRQLNLNRKNNSLKQILGYTTIMEPSCNYNNEATAITTIKTTAMHCLLQDVVHLGRYYLGKGKIYIAQALFQYALSELDAIMDCLVLVPSSACSTQTIPTTDDDGNDDDDDDGNDSSNCKTINRNLQIVIDSNFVADIIHALGACYLSMNQFMNAQRIWYEYSRKYFSSTNNNHTHNGLQLQQDKMNAYNYFVDTDSCSGNNNNANHCHNDDNNNDTILHNLRYEVNLSIHHNVMVTSNVLSVQKCQQLIQYAETFIDDNGSWTKQRHYAVPTYDIAIHTNPKLLNWFLNNFWYCTIKPLLIKQFSSTVITVSNLFIHDAFCVKYDATRSWNHLPIHTDESTHSFILALNDDYDGGGTYFYQSGITVRLKTGDVLSFPGDKIEHGGEAVSKGSRYIIVAFLYCEISNNDSITKSDSGNIPLPRKQLECHLPNRNISESKKSCRSEFAFSFLPS